MGAFLRGVEVGGEGVDPVLDGEVHELVADLHREAADEGGVHGGGDGHSGATRLGLEARNNLIVVKMVKSGGH